MDYNCNLTAHENHNQLLTYVIYICMRFNLTLFTFVTLIFLLLPAFYGFHPQNVPNKIAFLEKQRINKLIIKKIVQSENTDLLG